MQAAARTELRPSRDRGPPAPDSLRSTLRSGTAEAHARLDACFGRLDLQKLSDYSRFLTAQAAALLPLETALLASGVERLFPDWASRARSQALRADIACLGGRPPVVPPLPRLEPDAMLGIAYVLEGSRLGARFLLRRVLRSPDRRVAGNTAFLSHGAGSDLWQTFLDMLEREGRALRDTTMAIAAARRAFSLFEAEAARVAACETATA